MTPAGRPVRVQRDCPRPRQVEVVGGPSLAYEFGTDLTLTTGTAFDLAGLLMNEGTDTAPAGMVSLRLAPGGRVLADMPHGSLGPGASEPVTFHNLPRIRDVAISESTRPGCCSMVPIKLCLVMAVR